MSLSPNSNPDLRSYYYDQPGSLPGTIYAKPDAEPPTLSLIDFSPESCVGQQLHHPEDIAPYLDSRSISWVDVQGLGHRDTLMELGKVFGLHMLTLEDIANVPQRPKIENYDNHLLIVTHMMRLKYNQPRARTGTGPGAMTFRLITEQVSFVLGKHYLLTVQEEPNYDTFDQVRDRIYSNRGLIRQKKEDYLTYCILDTIIDAFFPILEQIGEYIELLENQVIQNPTPKTLASIHQIKRDLLTLRRAIWPQREMLAALTRDESAFISPEVQVYLRDCYDHAAQVMDMVEIYRELAASLTDVYLSSVSNRMNEVMKTLTVISTIFIPLTFIAGIYGMNFNSKASPWNMPELDWYWGYPLVWALMIIIALALILFFWRRGWFRDFS